MTKERDNSTYQTPEFRDKIRKIVTEHHSNMSEEDKRKLKKKISKGTNKGILDKYGSKANFKKEVSDRSREQWKDPKYREKTSKAIKDALDMKETVFRYSFLKGKYNIDSIYESKSVKKNAKYSALFSEVFY